MIDKTYIPLIHSPAERRKLGSRCSDSAAVRALQTDEAQRLADDTAIIGHPVRVQILTMLSATQGQTCVCDLEAALSVKQPTISHHLRLLREAGLNDYERHGQWYYYFVKRERVAEIRERVSAWLASLS